jgi:hypothetical protein
LTGESQGFGVHVDTYTRGSGKNSKTYTRFRVRYPRDLGVGLSLTKAGFFSGLASFFGREDIEIGDAAFDGEIVVQGGDPRRVRELLTPSRRMRISRFLASYPDATITDSSLEWSTRGVLRDPQRLIAHVNTLVRLAWHMVEDREEDAALARVIEAQDEGRPEEALRMLAERHRAAEAGEVNSDVFKPAPVEERLLEGGLLHLAGRSDEARQVFAAAAEETPDDAELGQWAAALSGKASPAATAEPAVASPADGLAAADVCEALFSASGSSFAAYQVFEDRYVGREVQWSGVLQRVDEFSYDLVFHGQEGCKGVIEIHELSSASYGQRRVLAIVQFPKASLGELRGRLGQRLEFTGRLAKADGLLRNLYLADGRLHSSGGSPEAAAEGS